MVFSRRPKQRAYSYGAAAVALAMAGVLAACAPAALAGTETRYTVTANGVTLEVSAPHADIVRVRAGKGALPEDASWAVSQDVRQNLVPMDVSDSGAAVDLKTSAVSVHVDKSTLAVTVTDAAGNVVLADAPGNAVSFENGGFRVRKAMPEDEHYFGLGDKTGPLDRRGEAFTLWNTDQYGFGVATDPLYKSIPFVLGADEKGHAFGLFVDNTWRSSFDFGVAERDAFSFGAEGGPVDYYVMAGATPKDVVEDYAFLTGTAPLAPQWALGFQQSHYSYMTQGEAKGIADHLRADTIPADVLYLDIDYQDRNRPFTVNKEAFPDLPGLVRDLKTEGMHLVLITDLHIANAPNQGYQPYDTGIAQDIFVHNPDGSTYTGAVWPGPAVFPDFSRPKAREWWGQQYTDFAAMGVGGFWNDMNEPSVFNVRSKTMPLDVVHRIEEPGFAPRNASHAEMHNVFGLLNSEATYDGLLKLRPDERPFVLTRASYAGGQRYAATWTGDNTSSWAHLKLATSQLVNLGLSGFSYAGDDIGGFAGDAPSPELLTRWIEIGAFNPIMRDHYAKGRDPQEVWVHGPEQEAIRRRYIEERYRLMPYIYGLAEENARDGLPIMRPVFLNFPDVLKDGVGSTENEFMLGGDLLIAPAVTGESAGTYGISLPSAGWYDYWTGQPVAEAGVMEKPSLDRLPVFVRPGAILPKQPLVQSTMETPKGALTLDVYPGADCRGSLYFDDGTSFAYRKGGYLRQTVTCTADASGVSLSFSGREGSYAPWWSGLHVVIHGWTHDGGAVKLKGRSMTGQADAAAKTLSIDIPDQPKTTTLRFQ